MYFDEYNADNDISENSLIFLLDEKKLCCLSPR